MKNDVIKAFILGHLKFFIYFSIKTYIFYFTQSFFKITHVILSREIRNDMFTIFSQIFLQQILSGRLLLVIIGAKK